MEIGDIIRLRPYQREGLQFLLERNRALNYDDMGLGKTLTTLTALEQRYGKNCGNKILILCPTNALYVWHGELAKWFNKEAVVYSGTAAKRQKQWAYFLCNPQIQYIVTTYGMLKEFAGNPTIKWSALVADEIHSNAAGLLNHKNAGFELVERFARDIETVYLLTGTPIRQGTVDLYGPLNIIHRRFFSSYWQFVNKYCITIDTPFGKSIERRPKEPDKFRAILNNYMLRRMKTDVLEDLPGKQRQPIFLEMTPRQQKVYNDLVTDMVHVDGEQVIMEANIMVIGLRLRQLLVCPRLLDIPEDGAALTNIISMGSELLKDGKPFVVFTPFREAISHITEALHKNDKNTEVYKISGGLTAEQFAQQWRGFEYSKETNKVLICVIKSGASFNATTAAHCFFLGYEWDFNQNTQSEDRLCRMGQKNFVLCYYMMHKGTIDEDIAARLNDKQDASNWAVGSQEQYELLLKRFKVIRDEP